jgi:Putative Flp pilus-assembly TadE/G-like
MMRSPISMAENGRRGMVIAQVALSMGVVMGVLALVIDGGLVLAERRHAQATADAVALAAAADIYTGSSGHGQSVATANGYTTTNSTVTINIPPQSGNFTTAKITAANSQYYAEAIVTYNMPRSFSTFFGSGTIPISARAVAQGQSVTAGAGSPAILLLSTTTDITDNGSNSAVSVSGTTGMIYLDGGATLNGNGASVTAPYVDTAESSLPSGVTSTVATATSQPLMADPLSYLPDPPTSSNAGSGVNVDSTYASSGITGTVTLNPTTPTIYIVGGSGIDRATLTANNAMFYLSGSASINETGNTSVSINQTTQFSAGTYAGISIFQARDDSSGWGVRGNAWMDVGGTIYAPAASIVLAGNGTGSVGNQIIASSLTMDGNGNAIDYSGSQANNHAPTRTIRLVE